MHSLQQETRRPLPACALRWDKQLLLLCAVLWWSLTLTTSYHLSSLNNSSANNNVRGKGVTLKRICKESYTVLYNVLFREELSYLWIWEQHHQKVVIFLHLKSMKMNRSDKFQTCTSGLHFPTFHATNLKSQLHPPYALLSPNADIQAGCSSFLFNRKVLLKYKPTDYFRENYVVLMPLSGY